MRLGLTYVARVEAVRVTRDFLLLLKDFTTPNFTAQEISRRRSSGGLLDTARNETADKMNV